MFVDLQNCNNQKPENNCAQLNQIRVIVGAFLSQNLKECHVDERAAGQPLQNDHNRLFEELVDVQILKFVDCKL